MNWSELKKQKLGNWSNLWRYQEININGVHGAHVKDNIVHVKDNIDIFMPVLLT